MTTRYQSLRTGGTLAALALLLSANVRAEPSAANDELPSQTQAASDQIAEVPPPEFDFDATAPNPAPAPSDTPSASTVPAPAVSDVTPVPVVVVPALTPLAPAEAGPPAPALPMAAMEMGEPDQAPKESGGVQSSDEQTGVYLGAQGGVVRRSLSFTQDVYKRLRTLNASLTVYRFDAAVYPSFYTPVLRGRLGFIASYEGKLTGSVHDSNFRADYPISHSELFGGLRMRHAFLQHELGFELTAGRLHSGVDDTSAAGIPSVSYGEVRSAVDFTTHFGRIRGTASAGFRVPLVYGQISDADWFPRVGGYGLEGSVKGSYSLTPRISVDASASLRRYVLEMNSEPEDPGGGRAEVAGGAVDAYFGGYVGMSFAL